MYYGGYHAGSMGGIVYLHQILNLVLTGAGNAERLLNSPTRIVRHAAGRLP